MRKNNWLKAVLIILFILLAGIFYSCRGIKEQETQINLQEDTLLDKEANQITQDMNEQSQSTKDITDVNRTTQDITEVNQIKDFTAEQKSEEITGDQHEYIYIHICGAVKEPDVYKVKADTRLVDVIKLAGGLTEDASGDFVNQAALVTDGQKVYIPTKDEVEGILPDGIQGDVSSTLTSQGGNTTTTNGNTSSGKVNINKASAEELMTLAGIGEAKAESIITYRQEHGSFKTIEDIKNINGIKDSVFNKISDMIIVN